MKRLMLTLVLIALTGIIYSQTIKHSDISNGKILEKGQYAKLIGGGNGKYAEYTASDGHVYKIGDVLKIGQPRNNKTFSYIKEYMSSANADSGISGYEFKIKWIQLVGAKKTGFKIYMLIEGRTSINNMFIDFEEALSCGEVIGYGKTSNQALTELKNAKEKLDLELITRQQFDSIKAELSKYIK